MKTITEYRPLIWGRVAELQARRMAAEARLQRAVNSAVERLMLPLIVLLFGVILVGLAGELALALFHLLVP